MTVRPGRREDLAGILEVYNHYVQRTPVTFDVAPIRAEERLSWIDAHLGGGRHQLWVEVNPDDDRVLGWATTGPFRPRAAYATTVEASVYCRHDRLGRGIGTRLYSALFAAIRTEEVERIVAGVTLPNPASVALHRRFGFQPVGVFTRVGHKLGRFWDVAWFERPLRIDAAVREHRRPPSGGEPSGPSGAARSEERRPGVDGRER